MLTKKQIQVISDLPASQQASVRAELEAKNALKAELRKNNPKTQAFLENRRQRRSQPFSVKANEAGTCAVVKVPGFAFPQSIFREQWEAFKANAAAIDAVVAKLKAREVPATVPAAPAKPLLG